MTTALSCPSRDAGLAKYGRIVRVQHERTFCARKRRVHLVPKKSNVRQICVHDGIVGIELDRALSGLKGSIQGVVQLGSRVVARFIFE